jgi:hypothetical protein
MLLHRMMGDADPCLHDCCARGYSSCSMMQATLFQFVL